MGSQAPEGARVCRQDREIISQEFGKDRFSCICSLAAGIWHFREQSRAHRQATGHSVPIAKYVSLLSYVLARIGRPSTPGESFIIQKFILHHSKIHQVNPSSFKKGKLSYAHMKLYMQQYIICS